MKRIYQHIIYTCLIVFLCAGCKPQYPHIDYEGNPGEVVFEHIDSPVPIYVAISDPLYENYTRGMGAFDNLKGESTAEDNWQNADIYVYAFYSPNGMGDAPKDFNYSERMDSQDDEKIFCLVDDADDENLGHGKRARLSRDMASFLQWTDNDIIYYNSTYQQYRYKFFAYHLDNAADLTRKPERRRDHVAYEVKIDGTQDLMCAHATPTAKQLESLVATGDKHIVNNLERLAYSTTTGHRDLFPIFQMDHQMAYVRFFLKADSIVNAEGIKIMDPEVKDVRVKNIIITAPYRGEFIVAAEDTNRLGVTFTDEVEDLYMPLKVKVDENGVPVTDGNGQLITVLRNEEGKVMAGNSYGFNPRLIPEAEEKEVGMGFLLPPSKSYELRLVCSQITTNDAGKQVESGYYTSKYQLEIANNSFKAGHKYEVCIKVYGQREINLGLGEITWKNGGNIVVDDDDDGQKQ